MKLLLLIITVSVLAGCGSTPKPQQTSKWCYTKQEIRLQNNERISSDAKTTCSDDPVDHIPAVRLGLSDSCGWYIQQLKLGGRDVQKRMVSCQSPDGSWDMVDPTTFGR